MALIILGGYCSHVTLCSWYVQSPGTFCHNNHNPPARKRWHALVPGVAYRWAKKEGWLNLVTCISVVLVTSLLVVTWILRCSASPLTASQSRFLPPLQDHVSSCHQIGHAHLADTSLSKAHKVLQ